MKFEVETSQVSNAVSRAQEIVNAISRNSDQMFRSIEDLNGMWAGEAHDVFTAQCALDHTEMNALVTDLTAVLEKFSTARKSYESCESSAVEMIAAIQV